MCNACLQAGVLPCNQKHVIVRPRLKKATLDAASLNSYRPISNLSYISTVVERVAAAQFVHHAEDNHLFPANQSSYRRNHSTETAVLRVHSDLIRAVDKKHVAALVLLDLSAAFDTVDHATLLKVLERRFGIRGSAFTWFTSYLSDRTQTFSANGVMSVPFPLSCGVPQGSVLGPIEFIAYTEDVSSIFRQHNV
jgi:hypothetical protein